MSARPAPLTGQRAVVGAALVTVAVLSGVWTLTTLVLPGPWQQVSAGTVVLLATVTTVVRQRTRSRTAPSAWGLAVAVVALGALYAGRGTTPSLPLPTPETVERFARLAGSGVTAIVEGRIPMEPVRGVELLMVTGAVAAFLLADLIALGLGRAGLGGVVLAGLWMPAVLFERTPSLLVLLVGGVAFLLLLALTRPQTGLAGRSLWNDSGPALAAAAGVAVLAVIAGPVASAMPFYGTARLPGAWGGGGSSGPLRLSTDLDMRSSLSQRSDRPVLTYTTDAADLGPLRLYTMVDFDGTQWDPGQDSEELVPARGWLWPDAADRDQPDPEPQDTSRVRIQIGDLDQDRLPIPINPRDVEADGGWMWDRTRDEIVGPGMTTRGADYVVSVAPRPLTPVELQADTAASVDPSSPYLAVPGSSFAAEIRALAQEVTAGAGTTYDQAVALQTYFRDVATFRYDPQVPPPQTDDAVWDFLTQRTGYCVQFATAMTIMARTVGIPARLAVGFLPGRPNPEISGQFVVSGRQAHAWPELYFADAGWVRFEPTPAAQTGAPPLYADPYAGQPGAIPEGIPTATGQSTATPGAAEQRAGGQAGGSRLTIGSRSVPLLLVLGVAVALLLVLSLVVLALVARARRRAVALPQGADAWWDELRTRLSGHGVTWSDATTPRQAAEAIREHHRLKALPDGRFDGTHSAGAATALDRLVAAVEAQRYSPAPVSPSREDLMTWVETVERSLAPEPERELVGAGRRG